MNLFYLNNLLLLYKKERQKVKDEKRQAKKMFLLPGIEFFCNIYNYSDEQFHCLVAMQYIVILLYSFLLILCLVNVWKILIRQGKWRTLPLLFFYIMSVIAISFRIVASIYYFDRSENWHFLFITLQPIAKGCVGLMQCWMIFELTLIMRSINKIDYGERITRK